MPVIVCGSACIRASVLYSIWLRFSCEENYSEYLNLNYVLVFLGDQLAGNPNLTFFKLNSLGDSCGQKGRSGAGTALQEQEQVS